MWVYGMLIFVYVEMDNEDIGKPVSDYFGVMEMVQMFWDTQEMKMLRNLCLMVNLQLTALRHLRRVS
ncbi:protein disulfide isomerase-like 1-4 [Iris pallida]|uniref:Protein disulfide isomerase-like 1-4 n=1 Tax=Iris pallida TaxID=29817 RepID=A0AAX6EP39_IRIPA|nr:protein disulfide isomerase-like 1-4 [Iris pallida]